MLDKELEILKHIEELYKGDISEDDFLKACRGMETRIQAWKEAFENFLLYDVLKAIDHYYVKKSSKTRPNIAQITAILHESGSRPDLYKGPVEKVEPDVDIKMVMIDNENGEMNWLVPHYSAVWDLIRINYFPFVADINNPTHEEFRDCMKRWSRQQFGRDYFCLNAKQISELSTEEQEDLRRKCLEKLNNFEIKRIN